MQQMTRQEAQPADTADIAFSRPSALAGWWATFVFFVLYALSFVDRQLLNLLVEPIKASLGVSDFQVSLMQGLTFAVFYTVFGLGIGWLVDNRPRRPIMFAGVALWSIATAMCGIAGKFWQLALARIGVAVGEASLAPAAYSLMSDIFPPRKLALPMSVMGAGAGIGGAAALVVGSYILGLVPDGIALSGAWHLEAWQVAFLVVGIPGLFIAPLIWTVRDPGRKQAASAAAAEADAGSVLRFIGRHKRFYLGHFIAFGVFSMINYAVSAWLPTFLIRRHGLELGEAGYAVGLLLFLVGLPGSLLSGWLVDRWYSRGRADAHLVYFAMCCIVQMLSIFAAVWVSDPTLALVLLIPQVAVSGFTGVAAAALQITTPARMRGQVSAIYLLVFNLLGLGLGPTIAAIFTDFVFADEMRVGSSLVLTYAIFAPVAAGLMLFAAPAMRRRIAEQQGG